MKRETIIAIGWVIGIIGFCIIVIAGWVIDSYIGFSAQYGNLPEGSYFDSNGIVGALIGIAIGFIFFIFSVGIAES